MASLTPIVSENPVLSKLRQLLAAPAPQISSDHTERLHVATCVLALEVASSDGEFSDEERMHIISGVCERFDLSNEQAEDLIRTSEEVRGKTVDLWKFTNHINNSCTQSEKLEVIETLWRIIYADHSLDAHEDYLIHKLGRLLNVNHPTLIREKLKVLNEIRAPR
jgi:uncharacterized tellurite resistance protein B-like protein